MTTKKIIGIVDDTNSAEHRKLEVEETVTKEKDGKTFLLHEETYFYKEERLLKKKAVLEADLKDTNNLLSHFPE